jgi:hypothetical protein
MIGRATLSLPADEPYQLPPLDFQGSRDVAVNGGSGTAVSLKKSGIGTVMFGGRIAVTGTTEIAEGVLRLDGRVPYGKSGLWHGIHLCSDAEEDAAGTLFHKRVLFKDNITNSLFYAYQNSVDLGNSSGYCVTFSGYLWNREPTSVVWTVTCDMKMGAGLCLNNDERRNQFGSTGRKFWDVTLNSGANYMEWRFYRACLQNIFLFLPQPVV